MDHSSTGVERDRVSRSRLDRTSMLSPSRSAKTLDVKDIRRAIPKHCFDPSLSLSLLYTLSDISTMTFLFIFATYIPFIENVLIRWTLWITYGFVQGLVFTGIWILAHECGHQALFKSRLTNNCVGFILHSLLLVPFFSWKFSHSRHHRYTNHMDKDTAFVPEVDEESTWRWRVARSVGIAEDSPVLALMFLVAHQLLGWPLYLLFYVTSGQNSTQTEKNGLFKSHFDPQGGIFSSKEQPYVFVSNLGLIGLLSTMWYVSQSMGYSFVFLAYGVPYLWVNHWIVAITFLHHTHKSVLHYKPSRWTFLDGALSTVDRDFGFIGRHFFHGIIEFHVIHHLFPRIPFYHAEEATEAMIHVLGKRYVRDREPFYASLWTTFSSCVAVKESQTVAGEMEWDARRHI